MKVAYIALGSNIEPRYSYLKKAIKELEQIAKVVVLNKSDVYETVPVGYTDQANFLNMVIEIETSLSAFNLLDSCQAVEGKLGRNRDIRWGPRTIDLDILLYNKENMKTDKLIIPHPRMHERAFVLVPLQDVNPNIHIQSINKDVSRILNDLPTEEKRGVIKWIPCTGEEE
ncbi:MULTISPECIES: 2-amino-4-hydroxy-6-hydroxymethyldihydropteridine diphosphokinase [Paraliobacillus]|uniref:2-amino-4-hydroxy-6- hydroxymethyldihydropteridine diphosphokinase n=1 Tax=Paraliobacillus TaxID=200903 RepID=UPI000DD3F72A|nr:MULTISPECIES: 2-amino-4-hydroxy-6-hydroxymethyldihydropteridine diphosphokinase [Paraliobacillus]